MSLCQAYRSSVGAKMVMALTGIGLLGFVLAHMAGNLQVFLGPDALNAYAASIKGLGPLLWVARAGLAGLLLAHVVTATRLTLANKAARPVRYLSAEAQVTSYAARTMPMTGLIVLAFVVYHLLHFTIGVTHPEHYALRDAEGRHDVYSMVVLGFREVPVAIAYLVAQALLAMHITHGASSLFQSLGVTHPTLAGVKRMAGPALGLLIFAGNAAIVLACLLGWVDLPTGGAR